MLGQMVRDSTEFAQDYARVAACIDTQGCHVFASVLDRQSDH